MQRSSSSGYWCLCGQVFESSQLKAAHCKYCESYLLRGKTAIGNSTTAVKSVGFSGLQKRCSSSDFTSNTGSALNFPPHIIGQQLAAPGGPRMIRSQQRNKVLERLESDNYADRGRNEKDLRMDFGEEDEEEDKQLLFPPKKKRRKSIKTSARWRHYPRTFLESLQEAAYEAYPPHVPTYLTATAEPSAFPSRRFCSVCGYWGRFRCIACSTRFCGKCCYDIHKETRCQKNVQ